MEIKKVSSAQCEILPKIWPALEKIYLPFTNSVVCCMTMPLKLTFTKELKMPKDEKVDNSESHGERKLNC